MRKISVKTGKYLDDCHDGYTHEICFLEIATDKEFITITAHKEHDGAYGGFNIRWKSFGDLFRSLKERGLIN